MADADFVRATITNAPDGFSVAVVLRRGERIDMWGVNFVASFDEAENVARTFALQHDVPWDQVEVLYG
jgi:hypothetical protein